MSITQPVTGRNPSHSLHCPYCDAPLPANAAFCSSCGKRIAKTTSWESGHSAAQNDIDMNTRYRITSLVRRRPYVSLFFAIDNLRPQQQRMVAMRDIDISSLNTSSRKHAMELVQREYDFLRYWQIPSVMPVIDLHYLQDHIFVVMAWKSDQVNTIQAATMEQDAMSSAPTDVPFHQNEQAGTRSIPLVPVQRLYTLQDLLQSGLGLPSERRSLEWTKQLCQALDLLHQRNIVLGDLDPYTIVFNSSNYDGQPALMVSWLLQDIRNLFLPISTLTNTSYFSSPEALLGNPEPSSDIYSLGAILYLLLTGTAPDVEPVLPLSGLGKTAREGNIRRRLRSPREINGRISSHIDECIMRALSFEPSERFLSAGAFAEALFNPSTSNRTKASSGRESRNVRATPDQGEQDADTVRIVPLSEKHLRRWQSSSSLKNTVIPRRPQTNPAPSEEEQGQAESSPIIQQDQALQVVDRSPVESSAEQMQGLSAKASSYPSELATEAADIEFQSFMPPQQSMTDESIPSQESVPLNEQSNAIDLSSASTPSPSSTMHPASTWEESAELPAQVPFKAPGEEQRKISFFQRLKQLFRAWFGPHHSPEIVRETETETKAEVSSTPTNGVPTVQIPTDPFASAKDPNASFLKQIQRTLLGEQRHRITAAAIIETPQRVQPNQSYTLRIHIMGRDEIEVANAGTGYNTQGTFEAGGLSSLIHGQTAYIEVRSALPGGDQSGPYAYSVQQAAVTMPAHGYAAEVTMPIQPSSVGPSGRRDRLHIFFLDEVRRPLYEKPFVVEVFVSHLVQPGREGHSVLTIPL